METILESRTQGGGDRRGAAVLVIGERMNATGREAFQAQLQAGDLSQLEVDVAEQAAGAPTCSMSTSATRWPTRSS